MLLDNIQTDQDKMKAHAEMITNLRRKYGNEAKSAIISKRAKQERQKHLQRINDRQMNE